MDNTSTICTKCGRGARIAYNKPHSMQRTKRWVKPNLQKVGGKLICTRCQRTLTKRG